MAKGRHRKGSPPEGPNGPPGGVTRRKLAAKAVKPWLPLILKIIDWLQNR